MSIFFQPLYIVPFSELKVCLDKWRNGIVTWNGMTSGFCCQWRAEGFVSGVEGCSKKDSPTDFDRKCLIVLQQGNFLVKPDFVVRCHRSASITEVFTTELSQLS